MKALLRLVPVASLLWLACETTTSNPGDEPVVPLPEVGLFTYDYTRVGDSLTLLVDTAWCNGAVLERDTLTVTGTAMVAPESLLTLTLTSRFPAGAVVRTVAQCTRLDSGAALEGRWRVTTESYTVVSGALTTDEARAWAEDTLIADSMIAQQGYELEFTATRLIGTFDGVPARVLLPRLTAGVPDSCRVTVTAYGNTVQFTGLLSGEVVTVAIDEHLNRRYTSSRASRVPCTVWEHPESCAVSEEWFADFLADNMPFADEFIQSETVAFVVELGAVDVTRVDDLTVEITGRITGDVVTVSCDSTGVVTFSGTGTGQSAWTTVRGSGQTPEIWWDRFIQDNIP